MAKAKDKPELFDHFCEHQKECVRRLLPLLDHHLDAAGVYMQGTGHSPEEYVEAVKAVFDVLLVELFIEHTTDREDISICIKAATEDRQTNLHRIAELFINNHPDYQHLRSN